MEPTVAILTIEKLEAEPIHFVSLELDQCFYDHHRVKIVLDLKQMGENVLESPMQKTSLINEKIQIDIQTGDDAANAYGFIGVITDVEIDLDAGDHGLLYIYAASPTIELERGKVFQSFSETSLKNIFNEVTQSLRYLNLTNKPKFSGDVKFSMQYKETDFQYLKRIAWMYGENLFFSGDSLVFGSFDEKETAKVTYDKELTEVKIGTRLVANTLQQYYHDINNEKMAFEYPLSEEGTFAGEAAAQSDKLNLAKKPDMPMDIPTFTGNTLQYVTEMRKKRGLTSMYIVSGKTKLYKVRIGGLLEVDFHEKMKVTEGLGTLRVIRVKHIFDERGHYYNEFSAVSSKHGVIPCSDVEIPVAQAIPGIVVDNVDPDGHGKIQVKFDFENKACDFWIPIMTPQGGGNANIGEERNVGFIFIPEIDDKIIISFFDGNPELPFTLGSMFHGANAGGQGGGKGNHSKSIRDKSGSDIVFDDKKGSITIKDKNGTDSTIVLDGEGNISITASKSISLTSGNANITLESAGDGTITISAKTISSDAKETFDVQSGKVISLDSKQTFSASAKKDATMSSSMEATVSGQTKTTVTATGQTIIDGAIVKLN